MTDFNFEQDEQLRSLVQRYGDQSWNRISKLIGKSEIKCHKRWLELNDKF